MAERDFAAIAERWARWATSRKAKGRVCKWTKLAARRHLDDLKRSRRRGGWKFYFSAEEAARVCTFIEGLPHVEGQWDSETIHLEDWQIFLLAVVFGWRYHADGLRRFDTAYIELARKNGKSALTSGVALYCLTAEGEPGPQVKTAATTGDQARIVFDVARKMVDRTPDLRDAFGVEALANAITCAENGGSMKPINAKASTQDGLNPHAAMIDELHAHKDRALFDVLKSARGARRNPLSWYITTAGYNTQGVCYEQRTLVTKILEGVIEADHYFGIIFTLDEGDDEFDESTWCKANPNLGVSVQLRELRGYATEAKQSPDSHIEYRTKRMSIWTTAKSGWVKVERWKRCNGPVDLAALRSVPAYGGLDLASTEDMCALRLVWIVDGRLKTWGRFYVPEAAVQPRTERGNVPYIRWQQQGHLVVTEGDVTDYEYIEQDVGEILSRFAVQEIAYDPWNALDLVNRLVTAGAPMVEFRQTIQHFTGAMKELERYYLPGRLDHGGDPVLAWNASNLVARRDANNNVAPDRKHSTEKIDGMVALLMALARALVHEEQVSVYETRGLATA